MRIKEFPIATSVGTNDVLLTETDQGTRQIKTKTLVETLGGANTSDTIDDIIKSKDFSKIIDKIYPIDSLYISYDSKSPASLFGGSWVQIKDRFLRAANDTSTGGADSRTLTTAQMPSHSHNTKGGYYFWKWGNTTSTSGIVGLIVSSVGYFVNAVQFNKAQSENRIFTQQTNAESGGASQTNTTGSGSSVSTMPAYQDVYVWRRIA